MANTSNNYRCNNKSDKTIHIVMKKMANFTSKFSEKKLNNKMKIAE